jgi:hypothetical protein
VINPYSKYILVWNLTMTVVYLISIFMDTLILGFHLTPLLDPRVNLWSTFFGFLMVVDIILKFFVAFRASQSSVNAEDEVKEEKLLAKSSSKVAASSET